MYRSLDGVSFEETWEANKGFRIPDIAIMLTASVEAVEHRLSQKTFRTRFEREHSVREEADLYAYAARFLQERRYPTWIVSNDERRREDTANEIVALLLGL